MFSRNSGKVNRSGSRTLGLDEEVGSNGVVQRNWEGSSVKLEPLDQGVKLEAPGPSMKLEPMDQSVKLEAPGPSVKVKSLPENPAWPTDSSYEAPCTHDPARTPGAYSSKYGSMALFRDDTVSAPSTSSHASGQGCIVEAPLSRRVGVNDHTLETPARNVGIVSSYDSLPKTLAIVKDSEGLTPLHRAARDSQQEVLEELLQIDIVDIDAQDGKGQTALHYAIRNANLQVIDSLLNKGANVNSVDKIGYTSLHYATGFCPESIEILLNKGVNIYAVDTEGCTPLHIAASCWNSRRGVELLLERGADFHAVDNKGRTPLHHTVSLYNIKVAEILLERGADVHTIDNEGCAPLHYAARNDYPEMVKVLLERGARVNAIDNEGRTPLHLAQSCGHGKVVNLLQQAAMQGPNGNMNNVNVENLYRPGMGRNC